MKLNPISSFMYKKRSIVGLSILCFFSILSLLKIHQSANTVFHRILSSSSYESCDIGTISLPAQPIIPIYAASYPGSGSQMTHYLFEAITGLEAGSEWIHK